MNKEPLIVKCNFYNIRPEEMEKIRQKIKKQMEESTPVVMLPSGFELAKVNVEILEAIKKEVGNIIYDNDYDYSGKHIMNQTKTMVCNIIDKYIAELKGENNENSN